VTVRVAAIDIGTNSTRLLVADADGGALREVERLLEITRLGDRVDADGELAEASTQRVETCVARYAERARELDASTPLAVATSAVRDAANGAEFMQRLEQRCGVRTRVLTGEQEARLTLRGVVSGRTLSGAVVVCDIGGGSTELIAGDDGRVDFAVSLNLGCVRMSERHLHSDPPTAEEVAALRREAAGMLPGDVPAGSLIGVAGTITTLATIDLGLDEEIPERVDGHELSAEAVAAQLQRLAALPLEERRQVRGLMPERASTIVAGTAILAELMHHLGAERLTVSERDILHGAALEAADQAS
jgi:exopolyphosphatase/guanosine-5'-triphosphate,3'-diphosphate pyrophosphatase